jgi:hypothetical protein
LLTRDTDRIVSTFENTIRYGINKKALTIFVTPHAPWECDQDDTLHRMGEALVQLAFNPNGEGGADVKLPPRDSLLHHPLGAALIAPLLWRQMQIGSFREMFADGGAIPAAENEERIHGKLADLANAWASLHDRPDPEAKPVFWREGLLIISMDMHDLVERELRKREIDFALIAAADDGQFYDVQTNRRIGDSKFGTDQAGKADNDWMRKRIVVLKLVGSHKLEAADMPHGRTLLNLSSQSDALPQVLRTHLAEAPFLMLGSGITDPLILLALQSYVLPHLQQLGAEPDPRRPALRMRWMILEPEPPELNAMCAAEYNAVRLHSELPLTALLDLLVFPLGATLDRIAQLIPVRGQLLS